MSTLIRSTIATPGIGPVGWNKAEVTGWWLACSLLATAIILTASVGIVCSLVQLS